ncbi:hypothetical protein SDRG_09521 [Saprolegnia diclina VS20]|uniref:J domain-containing protein n=1 Tax=Saprolegnia diclina (strain VS20) TaxID=1156394 RepID=T0Q5A3_SAPDV|nr:hypothetical protein SDRG_09521 [Saprolegnia diclina VS20]EQC32999.1 hypothetical protein SDRG_09521 [Saprolegnia diclina VS20]|eukprot:XP_008613685.1 hypothetical protein SDRG_09521 [Saprolegnia diclina VS20]
MASRWDGAGVPDVLIAHAAVVCAAVASGDADRFLHEDPTVLPYSVYFNLPPLYASDEFVLVETPDCVVCCVKAPMVAQQLIEVTERQTTFQYAGRVHASFHKRAVYIRSVLEELTEATKPLVFTGHSTAGSIAQLCLLETLFRHCCSDELQFAIETIDADHRQKNPTTLSSLDELNESLQLDLEMLLPQPSVAAEMARRFFAIGFGAPCAASANCRELFTSLALPLQLITLVNEYDCIPSIYNVAQASSLAAKTTTKFIAISKATASLLGLFPTVERLDMEGSGLNLAPSVYIKMTWCILATTAYVNMTWSVLHKVFRQFQDHVLGPMWRDVQYVPFGRYAFLSKDSFELVVQDDADAILGTLQATLEVLSAHALWQHVMPAYLAQVLKRVDDRHPDMDHYERLQVPRDASSAAIVAAYRSLALRWHPDRWSRSCDSAELAFAEDMFKLLAEAYEVLSDPTTRAEYDASLAHAKCANAKLFPISLDDALLLFQREADKWQWVVRPMARSASNALGVARAKLTPHRFETGNHDNVFLGHKMRVLREDATITYVGRDDVLPSDRPVPSKLSGLTAASVVGGAVALGAGVALVMNAWSQYSDSMKRQRQAHTVHQMPPLYLERLLTDDVDDDDSLQVLEEFYDCLDELELARLQQSAEDTFFDCLESTLTICDDTEHRVVFPNGASVRTPFGSGVVVDASLDGIYEVEIHGLGTAYVQHSDVRRGGEAEVHGKEALLETKRKDLVALVVSRYALQSPAPASMLAVGTDAALDSGVKAAGGVALVKSMERLAPRVSSSAAPLAIAAILVDIGREYIEYRANRKKHGKWSTATSERLLMQRFRLKAGYHVAGGTGAAAGATLGAYGLTSSVGYWTGSAFLGPVGLAAATGAAVVGGMLGYFVGASAYSGTTKGYFSSLARATDEIERLEFGAKVLFTEFDQSGSGAVPIADGVALVQKLCRAAGLSPPDGMPTSNETLSWTTFWEWVSLEAVRKLEALEAEQDVEYSGGWWPRYLGSFVYASPPVTKQLRSQSAPASLLSAVVATPPTSLDRPRRPTVTSRKSLHVEAAQLECLVDHDWLTKEDAYHLKTLMLSDDEGLQKCALETIHTMQEAWEVESEGGCLITSAFSPVDAPEVDDAHQVEVNGAPRYDERECLDVMCSLLSADGVRRLLLEHGVDVPDTASFTHRDLHGLALTYLADEPL